MVSNIGDGWAHQFPQKWPELVPAPIYIQSEISRTEFDELKKEVQELKKLLQAAKEFDEATGQSDCEMDSKVKLIKDIAKLVGVDLGDIFDSAKTKKKI